MVGDHGVWTTF